MATTPKISVVVASHGRPGWLARCLTSLRQLEYPNFEIVIAADGPSLEHLERHPAEPWVKTVRVDEANISVARNAGLRLAAGDIVTFLDDDAVAEPLWLMRHAEAFDALDVKATVGFVKGRNGISYQSTVTSVDAEGETHTEHPGDGGYFVPKLKSGRALKLVGTNFAVDRLTLLQIGGFDPAFRYFHDDTDMSLRLAASGHLAAAVPLAQVHHAFAPSLRRTRLRAPRDLTDIGRSTAIFALRYRGAPPDELKDRLFARERERLVGHMVRGTCEPRDIALLMATLSEGWRDGAVQIPRSPAPLNVTTTRFLRVPELTGDHRVFTARFLRRRSARRDAEAHIKAGGRASVFSFSLTVFAQRVRFVSPGVWLQTGGQFGRSVRTQTRYRWCKFANRCREEIRRVAMVRGIGKGAASSGSAITQFSEAPPSDGVPGAGKQHGTRG